MGFSFCTPIIMFIFYTIFTPRPVLRENLIECILVLIGLFLLFMSTSPKRMDECIYCKRKLRLRWGAEHFFCAIQHPVLSLKGWYHHLRGNELRNFYENQIEFLGMIYRENLKALKIQHHLYRLFAGLPIIAVFVGISCITAINGHIALIFALLFVLIVILIRVDYILVTNFAKELERRLR